MSSPTDRLERVWDALCARPDVPPRRFLLLDVYTSLTVHNELVTPRETVLALVLKRDRRVTRELLEHICRPGHVVEALCWLRQKHPNFLRSRRFKPEGVPEIWRHTPDAPQRYAQFRTSVKTWLKAWSYFI